ncbi:MAG TPA: NAD(P)/FAD-dependent oxidoreductase [Chloroflexota bacterium]|nr:NAD(P)/FAD-dependent oxidoreductase [Chloroflexota bacterium]
MEQAPGQQQIVVAGAGYAGLHVAQRLGPWLGRTRHVALTLVDQHDYHQLITELPRVATGTRTEEQVSITLDPGLLPNVRVVQTAITGFDLARRDLLTEAEPLRYDWLVLALGSRPNDFNIPGLADHVLYPYSADDAQRVWDAVNAGVRQAAATEDAAERARLMRVVIGGGGATGVELAGAFAEELPLLARQYGAPPELAHVILVEAGPTILAGSSPGLITRASQILADLGVEVRTNAEIAEATPEGFRLKGGHVIAGGVFIWAGGVKAPALIQGSGLAVGYNGRIKVDAYLRALDHPEIFVAGDLASVINPETGRALPPLAQIALEEADTVAHNLRASIAGHSLEPFTFRDKGFVVSVGNRSGVADIAGLTIGGRLAHMLKDAIEWEYRQSVRHLHGRAAV